MQSKKHSAVESAANIAVGYIVNVLAIALLFPLFGIQISLQQNLFIGVFFIFTSLARSYMLRRLFNRYSQQPS